MFLIWQLMSCGLLQTLKFSVLELQEHLDTYNAKREAAEQVSLFTTWKRVCFWPRKRALGSWVAQIEEVLSALASGFYWELWGLWNSVFIGFLSVAFRNQPSKNLRTRWKTAAFWKAQCGDHIAAVNIASGERKAVLLGECIMVSWSKKSVTSDKAGTFFPALWTWASKGKNKHVVDSRYYSQGSVSSAPIWPCRIAVVLFPQSKCFQLAGAEKL